MLPTDIVPFKCTTLAVITDSAGHLVPIIEVALTKDMWWSMPAAMSNYHAGKIFIEDLYDWLTDERPPDPPSWAWWEKQTTHNKQKRVCVFVAT